jgi:hypothetical protein
MTVSPSGRFALLRFAYASGAVVATEAPTVEEEGAPQAGRGSRANSAGGASEGGSVGGGEGEGEGGGGGAPRGAAHATHATASVASSHNASPALFAVVGPILKRERSLEDGAAPAPAAAYVAAPHTSVAALFAAVDAALLPGDRLLTVVQRGGGGAGRGARL